MEFFMKFFFISNQFRKTQLFTDNSKVYYTKGSLPSCGVGSVRNARIKSRRT